MIPVATMFKGDRRGNVEDCLDAPRTQRTAATGQRRGVDQMTAPRTIGASPRGETERCGIVADEVVQPVYRTSEGKMAMGRLARMHRATSLEVLGVGRQRSAQGGQPWGFE